MKATANATIAQTGCRVRMHSSAPGNAISTKTITDTAFSCTSPVESSASAEPLFLVRRRKEEGRR